VGARRILILEDDVEVQRVLQVVLSAHTIVQAMTLAQARQIAAEQTFDIVISDWNLPDGCGGDLLRELAGGSDRPHRILQSGWAPPELSALVEQGVVHRFFQKPVLGDLIDYIARLRLGEELTSAQLVREESTDSEEIGVGWVARLFPADWASAHKLYLQGRTGRGLGLTCSSKLARGASVRILMALPDGGVATCKGDIRYVEREPAGGYRVAVGLEPADPDSRSRLRALLAHGADPRERHAG
jgi:CheY-like chemotaxis protein